MQIVQSLDNQYKNLHGRALALVHLIPPEKLYRQFDASERRLHVYSCGEYLLRSAAAIEQTFGGINANLWDDPFEWTLPETLPTPLHVAEYLLEVEQTRLRTFTHLRSDADLLKEIVPPSGSAQTLFDLVTETLLRAAHFEGRAFALFKLFSEARLPRL